MRLTPHPLIDAYFGGVRARDIEGLVGLFAPDALMTLPDGRALDGTGAIRKMYEALFAMNPPVPTPQASIVAGDAVAVEIEAKLEDGNSRRTANFFYLNAAGLVTRLSIYKRD